MYNRGHNAAKYVNRSILKKSRHIGFGVFIVHSSMVVQLLHNSIIVKWRKGPILLCAVTFTNGPSVYGTRLVINYKLADLPRTLDGQGPLTMVTLYTHY
jgi:hypothetical protein